MNSTAKWWWGLATLLLLTSAAPSDTCNCPHQNPWVLKQASSTRSRVQSVGHSRLSDSRAAGFTVVHPAKKKCRTWLIVPAFIGGMIVHGFLDDNNYTTRYITVYPPHPHKGCRR